MTDCIFCKIVNHELPSAIVYEDEVVIAFLDMMQVTPGHTLVIPKQHVKDIYEYDENLASDFFKRIPKVTKALRRAFPESSGINIISNNGADAYQSVFHSHFHLLPRYKDDDFEMTFVDNSKTYTQEVFQERAKHIREHFNKE